MRIRKRGLTRERDDCTVEDKEERKGRRRRRKGAWIGGRGKEKSVLCCERRKIGRERQRDRRRYVVLPLYAARDNDIKMRLVVTRVD